MRPRIRSQILPLIQLYAHALIHAGSGGRREVMTLEGREEVMGDVEGKYFPWYVYYYMK